MEYLAVDLGVKFWFQLSAFFELGGVPVAEGDLFPGVGSWYRECFWDFISLFDRDVEVGELVVFLSGIFLMFLEPARDLVLEICVEFPDLLGDRFCVVSEVLDDSLDFRVE